MGKITVKKSSDMTLAEAFDSFILSATARGITQKTIKTYKDHFHSISKHLDISVTFSKLTKKTLEVMVVSMRNSGLAHNSVSSYMGVMKSFISWCNSEGYTNLFIPNYKPKETIKETYSDEELGALLKKPKGNYTFAEYRNWVIINFLLNCGCRAATIRNIQNQDVDLIHNQIIFRHNKNGKIQMIPLCRVMAEILRDYMAARRGDDSNYLFCDECGEMLTENALRLAISNYNKQRGVEKTSIHMFRHTFARKYLVDCGGNAFALQKLLGHSTLNMTKHYCTIFDADILRDYDNFSPLAQMTKERLQMKR